MKGTRIKNRCIKTVATLEIKSVRSNFVFNTCSDTKLYTTYASAKNVTKPKNEYSDICLPNKDI
jgi:hypothetical protein